MKLGFVTPRYGAEVIGGAELGARLISEHLVALTDVEVEVFTSCALLATTWADHFPAGCTIEAGVRVHRFPVRSGRHPRFDERSAPVLAHPERTSMEAARQWIVEQGPVCPEALDAAAASDCDVVAFYPYLYHPTVAGVPRLGRRAVMHPAAHDEPPLRLPVFEPVMAATAGFVFQTEAERHLVERRFPVVRSKPQALIGLGVDEHDGVPSVADLVGDRPYLLCLGRVDHGKGTEVLVRYHAAFADRHPDAPRLVLAGPVVHQPTAHPSVVVLGAVDEATKWGLLRNSLALVNPSAYEAFSIVVCEAWTAGVPVVVNARCGPTVEHCRLSGGGLWFGDYATYEGVIERLCSDPALCRSLAGRGRAYVDGRFRWPTVVDRYSAFLRQVAAHG